MEIEGGEEYASATTPFPKGMQRLHSIDDDLTHIVSTVTTNNNGLALRTSRHSREDGLNKVLGVVLLLEDLDLLSKAGSTGLLACQGALALVLSNGNVDLPE